VGANLCSLFGHADTTITDMWAAVIIARALYEREKRQWNRRCLSLGPGPGPGDDGSENVQTVMIESKNPDVSTTPSVPVPITSTYLTAEYPVDQSALKEAIHFFKFAYAVYGWMLFLLEHGAAGLAQIMFGCGVSGRHGYLGPCGVGRTNVKVALSTLDIPSSDLLFLREEGAIPNVLCYLIAVDHSTRSVVIAVRGAVSIHDNVKDVMFEAACIQDWLTAPWNWATPPPPVKVVGCDPKGPFAHAEYLIAAAGTLEDIQRQGVLREAMAGGPESKYSGYRLVVTGHSLGACVAYLMSLRLRLAFPDLKCWAFSPPLGLVCRKVGRGAEDWCTSVVCGKEIVPRYSFSTLDRARDLLMLAAARCRVPKMRVLLRCLWGAWDPDAKDLTVAESEISGEVKKILEDYRRSLDADEHRDHLLKTAGTFGLPGKVCYLRSTGGRHVEKEPTCSACPCNGCTCCCSCCALPLCKGKVVREHEAVWVDSDVLLKEGIMFSGRALLDHMPSSTQTVLRQLTPTRDVNSSLGGTNGDEEVRGRRGTQAQVENCPLNASAETSAPVPYSMEA
jgi:sn1-specific diacylglycerol lipase